MIGKILTAVGLGAALGCGATYVVYKHKQQETDARIQSAHDDIAKKDVIIADHAANATKIICDLYQPTVDGLTKMLDPDMLADITDMRDPEAINECLTAINAVVRTIEKHGNLVADTIYNVDDSRNEYQVSLLISGMRHDIETTVESALSTIEAELNTARQCDDDVDDETDVSLEDDNPDEDDDSDDDVQLVRPTKLVLIESLSGEHREYDTDPDDGFEVLDGSEPDENKYTIVAQNVPKLNKDLQQAIANQLRDGHITARLDPDGFENFIEDILILVSFSFVDETNTVASITEINAIIPFEMVTIDSDVYHVDGCNTTLTKYFGDATPEPDASLPLNHPSFENDDGTIQEKEIVEFLYTSIGYNRESITSLMHKLNILIEVNPEAGASFKDIILSNITDIQQAQQSGKLDAATRETYVTAIRTALNNMKRNYGAEIKRYTT